MCSDKYLNIQHEETQKLKRLYTVNLNKDINEAELKDFWGLNGTAYLKKILQTHIPISKKTNIKRVCIDCGTLARIKQINQTQWDQLFWGKKFDKES